jgi:flagella basal body P-ring formation protein FlgA
MEKLTAEFLSQGGELELRLKRPWTDVAIPDEPFEVKIAQLPAQGVSQSFSLRFELAGAGETFGSWQVPVSASLWKEVWVVARAMKRGEVLQPAELGRERRDLLTSRNHLAVDALELAPNEWELAENLPSGAPLNRWSLRRKPVVYRGQFADALVHNGPLTISLKVQVLEDAIPGQSVRIRNPNTKRELQGKVNHDQTISIQLEARPRGAVRRCQPGGRPGGLVGETDREVDVLGQEGRVGRRYHHRHCAGEHLLLEG